MSDDDSQFQEVTLSDLKKATNKKYKQLAQIWSTSDFKVTVAEVKTYFQSHGHLCVPPKIANDANNAENANNVDNVQQSALYQAASKWFMFPLSHAASFVS